MHGRRRSMVQEKLTVSVLATLVIVIISYMIPLLNPFFDAFVDYFSMIWWVSL